MGLAVGVLIFDFAIGDNFYQARQEPTESPNYFKHYISSTLVDRPWTCFSVNTVNYSTISQTVRKVVQAEVPF